MKMITKALYFMLPVLVWMLIIFTFSNRPAGVASTIDWQDFILKKTAHVLIFGVLSLLTYRALRAYGVSRTKAVITAVVFTVLYGFSDEYHQSLISGRTSRLRDVGFDTIGSILSLTLLWYSSRKAPKKLMKLVNVWDMSW